MPFFKQEILIIRPPKSTTMKSKLGKFSQIAHLYHHLRHILKILWTKFDREARSSFLEMLIPKNSCFRAIITTFGDSNRSVFKACCCESVEIFWLGRFVVLPCDCFDVDLSQNAAHTQRSAAEKTRGLLAAANRPAITSTSRNLAASLVLHFFCMFILAIAIFFE